MTHGTGKKMSDLGDLCPSNVKSSVTKRIAKTKERKIYNEKKKNQQSIEN